MISSPHESCLILCLRTGARAESASKTPTRGFEPVSDSDKRGEASPSAVLSHVALVSLVGAAVPHLLGHLLGPGDPVTGHHTSEFTLEGILGRTSGADKSETLVGVCQQGPQAQGTAASRPEGHCKARIRRLLINVNGARLEAYCPQPTFESRLLRGAHLFDGPASKRYFVQHECHPRVSVSLAPLDNPVMSLLRHLKWQVGSATSALQADHSTPAKLITHGTAPTALQHGHCIVRRKPEGGALLRIIACPRAKAHGLYVEDHMSGGSSLPPGASLETPVAHSQKWQTSPSPKEGSEKRGSSEKKYIV